MAARDADSIKARAALAALCETYWYPLYAYVRRHGADPEDARDLTQGFLTSLLERRDFEKLEKERGRFRAFLLASLKHFLANDAARRLAQKRGASLLLPLTFDDAEGRYRFEPAELTTPESLYERHLGYRPTHTRSPGPHHGHADRAEIGRTSADSQRLWRPFPTRLRNLLGEQCANVKPPVLMLHCALKSANC